MGSLLLCQVYFFKGLKRLRHPCEESPSSTNSHFSNCSFMASFSLSECPYVDFIFKCLNLNKIVDEGKEWVQIGSWVSLSGRKGSFDGFQKNKNKNLKKEENHPDLLLMLQRAIWQETKPAVNLPSRKNAIPLLVVMKHSAVLWWESIKFNTFYMIANSLKYEDAVTV